MAEKAEAYLKKILSSKGRLAAAVCITAGLFVPSCFYLYDGINKRFFVYTALCLFTGILTACPMPPLRPYLNLLPALVYILVVPHRIFQRTELPVHDMNGIAEGAAFANIAVILFVYAVLLLITRRIGIALGAGGVLFLLFLLLNYYTMQSIGCGLNITNLSSSFDALPFPNSGRPFMSSELWYSVLYLCFFIALGFRCGIPAKGKRYHIAAGTFSLAACVLFLLFWNVSGYQEKHNLTVHNEAAWKDAYTNGSLLSFYLRLRNPHQEPWKWYEISPVVCHGLGMTEDGTGATNSLESLEYSYFLGYRVFETDIAIAADNVPVLRHDWEADLGQEQHFGWTEEHHRIPDSAEFLEAPIYGKYTPMTLLMLYEIMDRWQDMYVIIDPKYNQDVVKQFTLLVDTAVNNGYESVLDRIVVQLYYEEMYDLVESVYHFQNYLYTLYYIGYPGAESVGNFCEKNGIPVVVMPYTWMDDSICPDLQARSLRVYVHTVTDMEEVQPLLRQKIDGIYTEQFLPVQMRQWLTAQ